MENKSGNGDVRLFGLALNRRLAVLLLLLAVVAAYWNSLSAGFVWDDHYLIVQKGQFFSDPGNALAILKTADNAQAVKTPYYRPLSILTFMMDYHLWGQNPFWYHLENLLLHAVCVLVFYLLVAEVFGDGALAFISALLFALYPVNAEAVDFISARNTLLNAAFVFGSLLVLKKGGPKRVFVLAAAGLFFLSLLSKEQTVALPFFLLCLALLLPGENFAGAQKWRPVKKWWMTLPAFFAAAAGYMVLRRAALGMYASGEGIRFSAGRLVFISNVVFEGARLMVFPFNLNALYTNQSMAPFSWLKSLLSVLWLAMLIFLAVRKKTPAPLRAGALWFLWMVLPVSDIIPIPSAPVAERFYYLPAAGFALMAGYALRQAYRKVPPAGVALIILIAVSFEVRTFERNFVWWDNLDLYQSMVRADPGNVDAYNNLGTAYLKIGKLPRAIGEFETAISINPYYSEAHDDLGMAFTQLGRLNDAVRELTIAVDLKPGSAVAHNNLGAVYGKMGRYREAIGEFQAALRIYPGYAQAGRNLGMAEEELKKQYAGRAK